MWKKYINSFKFIMSLVIVILFFFVIIFSDKFYKWTDPIIVNENFIQSSLWKSDAIDLDMISVEINNNDEWIITYIVKAWDSLDKIANKFWVTISHIQKVNNIQSWNPIRPWQKIVITDQEDWFLYSMKEKINVLVFANKYNLEVNDLLTLNYLQDETELLMPWQEIFISISKDEAYKVWLLQKPKPVVKPKIITNYKPVISKQTTSKTLKPWTTSQEVVTKITKSEIISQRAFNKPIKNKFYAWYCTWYAAIIMPSIFPYIDENTQARPFGWNAVEWYDNAKKAWFSVGKKPMVWALIIYYKWWRLTYAWHVWKVINYYPDTWKMIIRDMNRVWKFIVTERRESVSNSNIKWYIYPPKTPWKPWWATDANDSATE